MAEIIIIISVILIILLTLTQEITVRISFCCELIFDIDFLFIRLILYPQRRHKKIQKKKKDSFKNKISRYNVIRRVLYYAVRHSDVCIYKLTLKNEGNTPATLYYLSGIYYIVYSIFLTTIKYHSKSLTCCDNAFILVSENNAQNNFEFDVSLKLNTLNFLTAICLYFRESKKSKKKVVNANVRN